MFKRILQTAGQLTKAMIAGAIQNSGVAAVYLGTSTLLAGILLAIYLSFAWNITPERWYRAYAVLYGVDQEDIQKAKREQIAEITRDDVVERRAVRNLNENYNRDITEHALSLLLPPEDPKPPPPQPPSDADRISAYEKRIAADRAKAESAGLAEAIRTLENMDADLAKEEIILLWKDGKMQFVLSILNGMEDKRKDAIYGAFQTTNDEETKVLKEILQKIGDGEPMTSIIQNAAKEPS
jgi:hypothetical protein